MSNKKIFILLPDGVGLKFCLHRLLQKKWQKEMDLFFWNHTHLIWYTLVLKKLDFKKHGLFIRDFKKCSKRN
jgi:hypothetical protein